MSEVEHSEVPSEVESTNEGLDLELDLGLGNDETQVETEEKPEEVVNNLKKKFLLKVDGEEFEEEFDLSDEESLKKELQLARAAKKRMAEAAEIKKKNFEIMQQLEQDPIALAKKMGPKGREIIEKYLYEQLIEENMSPEEKEYKNAMAELEQYRAEKKQAEEQRKLEAETAEQQKYEQYYQNLIIEGLEKSGLPKTPQNAQRMASLLQKNLSLGLELTPSDLANEVKRENLELIKTLSANATPEQLLELFGADVAKKIRQHDLKMIKSKQMQGIKTPSQVSSPAKSEVKRPMTTDEYREMLNERMKTLK
jgi:hypothetical protein